MQSADDVIDFWFTQHGKDDWFAGAPEFDAKIAARFTDTHRHAALGEAWTWRNTAHGRLAEILVLDQFSRQLFRNSPLAYAQDGMALALAQEAVAHGHDMAVMPEQRAFFYLPFMHSESLIVHHQALRLYTALGNPDNLDYEKSHFAVLEQFGRYPFRNEVLGRTSTPAEADYIEQHRDRGF